MVVAYVLLTRTYKTLLIGNHHVIPFFFSMSSSSSSSSAPASSSPFNVERPVRRCLPQLVAAVPRRANLRRVIIDLTEELDSSDDRAIDNMADDDVGGLAEMEVEDRVRDDVTPPPPYISPRVSPFSDSVSPFSASVSPLLLPEQPVRPWAGARDYHAAHLRGAARRRAAQMKGISYRDLSDEEIEGLFCEEQVGWQRGDGGGVDGVRFESVFVENPSMEDRYCDGEDPWSAWWVMTDFGPLTEEMYRFQLEGSIDLGERDEEANFYEWYQKQFGRESMLAWEAAEKMVNVNGKRSFEDVEVGGGERVDNRRKLKKKKLMASSA